MVRQSQWLLRLSNSLSSQPLITRRHGLELLLVLLVAAVMRLSFPTAVEYFHDEAMLTTLAQEMALDGHSTTTGILSSTGIPNPPTGVYLMAVPLLLSPDPASATIFVMLLNVAGVGLLYVLVLRYIQPEAALVAGLFYAVNPWAVWFSRRIWAQDFNTPLLLLALLLLCYGVLAAKPHRWAQALVLPVLLFAMQIHFAAWALLPAFGLVLWRGRRSVSWSAIIVGVGLGFLVMLPYLTGLAQTLQADPNRIAAALTRDSNGTNPSVVGQSLADLVILASGQVDILTANNAHLPDSTILLAGLPLLALTLLGGVALLRERRPLRWALLWWAVGAGVLLIIPVTPVYIHYFVTALPMLAVLAAGGWMAFQKAPIGLPRLLKQSALPVILGIAVVGWFATLSVATTTSFTYPAFTTPLTDLLAVREQIGSAQDVVVVSNGLAWDLKHDVAVWETLLRGRVACVRTIKDGYAVWPSGAYSVLITPDGATSMTAAQYRQSNTDATTLTARQNEPFTVIRAAITAPPTMISLEPIRFDNGADLIGYQRQPEAIVLFWQLNRSASRGEDYQYTVQAYDEAGQPLGQSDGRFWQGMNWCTGDTLGITISYAVPATTAELRVGLYRLGNQPGEYLSASVLDAAGQPSGQSAIIRLP